MPLLLSHPNFPSLRKNVPNSDGSFTNLDPDGFTSKGLVVPGILHMGQLPGVAAFQGLPAPRAAEDGEDLGHMHLTSAADIIVSILYKRDPNLLRCFLRVVSGQQLTYLHSMEGPSGSTEGTVRLEERPFLIVRTGDVVEVSGPRDGRRDAFEA